VPQFEIADPTTGNQVFRSVGHRFEAIACLDAAGLPTAGPCATEARDFRACATSGCHGTAQAARTAYTIVRERINTFLDELWLDTNGDGVIDATDGGLLPQVVAQGDTAQLDPRDQLVTVAEGALWNAQMAFTADRPQFGDGRVFGIRFRAHRGSGNGVHNPFLLEALLAASRDALIATYGLASPADGVTAVRALMPPGVSRRVR
jgi:hypothetical protein